MRLRPIRKLWIASAAIVLIGGCASVPRSAPGGSTPSAAPSSAAKSAIGSSAPPTVVSTTAPPIPAGAQHNYTLAAGEAQRLMKFADLPSTATRLTQRPPRLASSAIGTPASTSLIDIASFWQVPMSQTEAGVWIEHHAPPGLTADFSSSGVGGPAPASMVIGFGFSDHRIAQAWTQAALEISVSVVDAHTSAWRVEGEDIWLDPTPIKDTAAGPRMRVTAASGCPKSDQKMVGVINPPTASRTETELSTELIPPGTPTGGLVCAYDGANGRASALNSDHVLSASTARELAQRVRDVVLANDTGGAPTSCPADDGAAAVLVLSFAGQPDFNLWLLTGGCRAVYNGEIGAGFTSGVWALSDAVLASKH